jgi:hypothetical protein
MALLTVDLGNACRMDLSGHSLNSVNNGNDFYCRIFNFLMAGKLLIGFSIPYSSTITLMGMTANLRKLYDSKLERYTTIAQQPLFQLFLQVTKYKKYSPFLLGYQPLFGHDATV